MEMEIDIENQLNLNILRYVDHSTLGLNFNALKSFAFDDTFSTSVGRELSHEIVRTWVHRDTVVLGIQDSRLPYIDEGRKLLEEKGYQVIVRNSGGLAVLLDDGILNISLIVREKKGLTIDAGFDLMHELIKKMFADFNVHIRAYEIVGSYCPGDYDLSIDGKKFAGISQRRIRDGVAVQIYLCVNGSGSERADVVRQFYEMATKGEPTKYTYPKIIPSTMASLSELLHQPLTVSDVVLRLLQTFASDGVQLVTEPMGPEETELFSTQHERILERNERFL